MPPEATNIKLKGQQSSNKCVRHSLAQRATAHTANLVSPMILSLSLSMSMSARSPKPIERNDKILWKGNATSENSTSCLRCGTIPIINLSNHQHFLPPPHLITVWFSISIWFLWKYDLFNIGVIIFCYFCLSSNINTFYIRWLFYQEILWFVFPCSKITLLWFLVLAHI